MLKSVQQFRRCVSVREQIKPGQIRQYQTGKTTSLQSTIANKQQTANPAYRNKAVAFQPTHQSITQSAAYSSQSQSAQHNNMTTPAITVHHLENSRSQRILWLLEELGANYEIKLYKRTEQGLAPKSLYDVHPMGKSPVITVNDGTKTRTIAESGAIVDYLINKFGRDKGFIPTDEDQQMDVTFWNHFAEGSLMPPLVMSKVFTAVKTNAPFIVRPIAGAISSKIHDTFLNPTLKSAFDMIETTLNKPNHQFIAGTPNLTAADFMMIFPLEAANSRSTLMGPKAKEYVARMHARPAYKTALDKGGKYEYA